MNKDILIKNIDKIVADYKEAHMGSKYNDLSDLHNDALIKNLEVWSLDIIESASIERPVYKQQAYYQDGRSVSIPKLIGILEALKAALQDPNSLSRNKQKGASVETRDAITEEHIKKLTVPQLIKKLSLGVWVLVVSLLIGSFVLGYNFRRFLVVNDNQEISLGKLTGEQEALVLEIWKYQKSNNLNKVIISRNGFIFDATQNKNTDFNLATKVLGVRGTELKFEKLITSVPADFLRFIPETRLGSPYIVVIPEEVRKNLDRKL